MDIEITIFQAQRLAGCHFITALRNMNVVQAMTGPIPVPLRIKVNSYFMASNVEAIVIGLQVRKLVMSGSGGVWSRWHVTGSADHHG